MTSPSYWKYARLRSPADAWRWVPVPVCCQRLMISTVAFGRQIAKSSWTKRTPVCNVLQASGRGDVQGRPAAHSIFCVCVWKCNLFVSWINTYMRHMTAKEPQMLRCINCKWLTTGKCRGCQNETWSTSTHWGHTPLLAKQLSQKRGSFSFIYLKSWRLL